MIKTVIIILIIFIIIISNRKENVLEMKLISDKFPPKIFGDRILAEEIMKFSSIFDEQIEETAKVPFCNNFISEILIDPSCENNKKDFIKNGNNY